MSQDAPMAGSRPIETLCYQSLATLVSTSVTDEDLHSLGLWDAASMTNGLSPAVASRSYLCSACKVDPALSRRLSDRLDLRYMETTLMVRSMRPQELARLVDDWVGSPDGQELPALVWSLCTDARDSVHALGSMLCQEAIVAAIGRLVEGVRYE